MNQAIVRLFVLVVALFGVLVFFTSRWAVFEADDLQNETANKRPLIAQQQTPRGLITARDGTKLAISVRQGSGETLRYSRRYPQNDLFSQALGYSFIDQIAGTERYRNDQLAGRTDEFNTLLDDFAGSKQEGNDVKLNLDPQAQRVAIQGLGGQKGAVVALEPRTGKVRVMASVPQFNPNDVRTRSSALNTDPGSPLLNRTTQGKYPPGSTMKVVTATAAIDSGKFTPDSVLNGKSPQTFSGTPLSNFGGSQYGPISLTEALTNSVNTVWARVGERIGKDTLYQYMDRFGFNAEPELDYPRSQMVPSGVYGKGGRILKAENAVDIARVAIGQERLLVTPLQMAEVAAAVGNGGKLMKPRLADRVTKPDGRVDEDVESSQQSRVMSEETAQKVGDMMSKVVEEGSGTAAALSGIKVAGKTGTAEIGDHNQVWFIGFAPRDNPRAAVAVTIETSQGTGGEVAAPIAKQVLETLLRQGG